MQQSVHLVVDGVPYIVKIIPFDFNGERRFRVSYNEGPEHIFTWHPSLGSITAIDDESVEIPGSVEQAIAAKLLVMAEKNLPVL